MVKFIYKKGKEVINMELTWAEVILYVIFVLMCAVGLFRFLITVIEAEEQRKQENERWS